MLLLFDVTFMYIVYTRYSVIGWYGIIEVEYISLGDDCLFNCSTRNARLLIMKLQKAKPSVESGDNGNSASQPFNRSLTALIPDVMDPVVAYFPHGYASSTYYYEGYDGAAHGSNDYSRYVTPDVVDASHVIGQMIRRDYDDASRGDYDDLSSIHQVIPNLAMNMLNGNFLLFFL
ncbi:hypothetical protein Hanom_Chr03g00227061 [Helianthus anomalus]